MQTNLKFQIRVAAALFNSKSYYTYALRLHIKYNKGYFHKVMSKNSLAGGIAVII